MSISPKIYYLRLPPLKNSKSENVPSVAQVKISFASFKSYLPFWRYPGFCIFKYPVI